MLAAPLRACTAISADDTRQARRLPQFCRSFSGHERANHDWNPGTDARKVAESQQMRPGMWYPVVERNPAADNEEARPGYVWVDLGNGEPPRHVWARHLEIREV
jgi:hypothetical protein